MLWVNSIDPNDWPNVTRHTVLGLWHQLKLEMYREYVSRNSVRQVDFSDVPF